MSDPTPARPSADLNLLFGVLALQMDFVSRDGLVAAMNAWVLDKAKPLGQILAEQGALGADERALLDALVQKHLRRHGGDAEKSLAAVRSVGPVRQELRQIADPDLNASLAHASTSRDEDADPNATCPPSVGTPTSTGLRFRILRPHARGGLGEVFVAHDEELRREVALKEIQDRYADDPHSRARFLLEAEITGGLEHPGIVPVYGLGQYADGRPFYAMRFVRGDSLHDAIDRFHQAEAPGRDPGERTLALRQLLGRFVDVCDAIAYAHSRGVLHRDLKPANVMLGQYGETLVVDWGLAKPVGRPAGEETAAERPLQPGAASGSAPTQMGSAIGTPQYMPPEQAAGRLDELGPASDVYSLGATLYHLLTGKPPFGGPDRGDVLRQVQRGDFPPPRRAKREVPRALEAVCLQAMALKPEGRYPTPRALAADVQHWLADEPVSACREPWAVRAGRWGRRHKPLVTGAAVLLLAAVAGLAVGVVLLGREQARTDRARQEARGHFRRSRDVVDRMLVRFADSPDGLRDAPGMTELRRQVVEEALDYYQAFLETDSADPDVRQEAGRAFLLVGRVRRQAGQGDEAERAFLRARELFAGLAAEFPAAGPYRLDLAQCHTRLGALYQELKRFTEAGREYRAAVGLCEPLAAAAPDDPKPRFQLATSRNNLGTALREAGEAAAAEAEYRESLRVAQELAERPGATPEHRAALAHVRNNLGNLYTARTRWAEGLAEIDAAAAVWRRLGDEFPRAPDYRSLLATAEGNRINPLLGLGRKGDAIKAADASLRLRRRLADDFPTVPVYQADLAAAHQNRGVALRDAGAPAAAEQPLQSAVEAWGKLARDLPHLPEYRLRLASALSTLAQLRDRLRRPKEAEDGHRAALAELRGLAADHGPVRPYRSRLADEYNSLACFLINHDRAAEAEGPLGEAVRLWRDLRREAPDEPSYPSDLGMALGNRAAVLTRRQDLSGARRALEEAVACHERALALAPKHARYREHAARELAKLADCALTQGDHAAGVAAAEKRLPLSGDRTESFYSLACACGRAIAAAEKDAALPEARRAALAHAYAERAVACLREVQRAKPLILVGATLEKDLAPLRQRVDLRAALANPPATGAKGGR